MKNAYTIHEDYVEIFINQKGNRVALLIDLEDLPKASSITGTWFGHIPGGGTKIYGRGRNEGILVQFHRWILGNPEGMVIDHIDGNTLNNRRSNLRVVTQVENIRNTSSYRGTLPLKGVRTVGDRYNAWIQVDKKKKHLGNFNTFVEAGRARVMAEVKYYNSVEVQRTPIRL